MNAEGLSDKRFGATDIMKLLGVSRNKLFYWFRTHGLVTPVVVGEGSGNRTKFSFTNLVELALVKELVEFGFDLRSVKAFKYVLDSPVKEFEGRNVFESVVIDQFKDEYFVSFYREGGKVFSPKVEYMHPRGDIDADENNAFFIPGKVEIWLHEDTLGEPVNRAISLRIEIGKMVGRLQERCLGIPDEDAKQ